MAEENKYAYNGIIRWSDEAVGKIGWDPENKTGEASVTDEVTGTVYTIGEGGEGEESDFSTATVTVGAEVAFQSPIVVNEEEFQGIVMIADPREEQMIWQVPLYKGKCMVNIYTSDEGQTISVSGNITEIDTNIYNITGDCTITIGSGVE